MAVWRDPGRTTTSDKPRSCARTRRPADDRAREFRPRREDLRPDRAEELRLGRAAALLGVATSTNPAKRPTPSPPSTERRTGGACTGESLPIRRSATGPGRGRPSSGDSRARPDIAGRAPQAVRNSISLTIVFANRAVRTPAIRISMTVSARRNRQTSDGPGCRARGPCHVSGRSSRAACAPARWPRTGRSTSRSRWSVGSLDVVGTREREADRHADAGTGRPSLQAVPGSPSSRLTAS